MKTTRTPKGRSAGKRNAARDGRPAKAAQILGRATSTIPPAGRLPAKWQWHYRALRALQSRLLQERGQMRQAAAEPLEPHSMDEADSATDEFDHDLALSQLSAEQDALCEVTEALTRIRNGTYGVCEETGEAIPAARLKAVPWARFTVEVEERLEKKGLVRRPRLRRARTVRGSGNVWLAPEEEAEEAEEQPPAPPKEEALFQVFSPPGRHIPRHKAGPPPPKSAKRKGHNK